MNIFAGKTAVVTGAASGIGRALAQELARMDCHLALADIDLEGLLETQRLIEQEELRITAHRLDVANRNAVYEFAESAIRNHSAIDIVINNAGVSVTSEIDQLAYDDFEWLMGINFWGMVYGTKAFLPHLRTRPEAWIANVSSILGIISVPTQGAYHASKFAIRGFSESLRHELADTNIHVATIHPGGVKTDIARNMRFSGSPVERDKVVSEFDKIARTTATRAAQIMLKGLRRKKKRILVGADAWLLDKIQRLFPTASEGLIRRMYTQQTAPAQGGQHRETHTNM